MGSSNAVIHDGHLDPGVRLLEKPFTTRELAQAVRQALDERRHPSLFRTISGPSPPDPLTW